MAKKKNKLTSKNTPDKPLTIQQERFCNEYFKAADGNGTKAAVLAGYSVKTATSQASTLLTYPNIQRRLSDLREMTQNASVMTVLERKQRLSEIARAALIDFVGPDGDPVALNGQIPNHRALQEYGTTTTTTKSGNLMTTRSIKLLNPVSAISELNKMDHIYDERPTGQIINNYVFVIGRGYQDPKTIEILDSPQQG